jgi:hypothetical protein
MPTFNAVYRGTVVNSVDPLQRRRVQVRCDSVLGAAASSWAESCLPPGSGAGSNGYRVGDRVWICFEGGDPDHPVVMGKAGG